MIDNYFIYYHRSSKNATIVSKVENGVLKLSGAVCCSKDKFVKKTGRELAISRYEEGKFLCEIPIPMAVTPRVLRVLSACAGEELVRNPKANDLKFEPVLIFRDKND